MLLTIKSEQWAMVCFCKLKADDLFWWWGKAKASESDSLDHIADTGSQIWKKGKTGLLTYTTSKWVLNLERHFWREWGLIELVIPTTDNLPQEGLLMWDSHYLMGNFMLISWTDQIVLCRHASLNKLLVFLPMDIYYLFYFSLDYQTFLNSHLQ